MGSYYLYDLADVCRTTGYPVIEVDDWQNRARGSGGYDPGQPGHVIVHHTASGPGSDGWPDVNYCCYGNPDSPVGNLYLSRVPEIYVMAGGAANTNGSGSDPCGIVPDDGMNARSIAIEAGNGGTGEPWNEVQQDCYVQLVAALCTAYGIGVEQVHAHWEWTPDGRKIDPAGESEYAGGSASWDMDTFRDDVDDAMAPEPEPTPPEDDMTDEQARTLQQCLDGIISIQANIWGDGDNPPYGSSILGRLDRVEAIVNNTLGSSTATNANIWGSGDNPPYASSIFGRLDRIEHALGQ